MTDKETAQQCFDLAMKLSRALRARAKEPKLQGLHDLAYVIEARAETCEWLASAIKNKFKLKARERAGSGARSSIGRA